MRTLLIILFCFCLVSAALAAERTAVIAPLDGPAISLNGAQPAGVCVYGNDNGAAYAITDWIWGGESYAASFQAEAGLCTCTAGFKLEQVHMLMNFGPEDVPVTFEAYVSFHEADADPTNGCRIPGPEICASPLYTLTIDNPGLYDIALPMDLTTCPCAFFEYGYAAAITIPNLFPSTQRPDAVTDAVPVGCTTWNDYGTGWQDATLDIGFPGELIVFADVVCCDPPVSDDASTWGGVKSLFR